LQQSLDPKSCHSRPMIGDELLAADYVR